MAENSRGLSERAVQKEKRGLGPLREIMRQYDEGELSLEQLQLFAEHKNPFDLELLKALPGYRPEPIKVKLEKKHFRVESFGWTTQIESPSGAHVSLSPRNDIKRLIVIPESRISSSVSLNDLEKKEFIKQVTNTQYFSYPAALRETKKFGKLLPTVDDWLSLLSAFFQRDLGIPSDMRKSICDFSDSSITVVGGIDYFTFRRLQENLNIILTDGCDSSHNHSIGCPGDNVHYWCREECVSIYFSCSQNRICLGKQRGEFFFPVRCLK